MLRMLAGLTLAASVFGCAARADLSAHSSSAPPTPGVAAVDAAGVTAPERPERSISAHLQFLASDALNGRGRGTRDEWITATYLGAQLARMGLEPMGDDGWFVQQVDVQGLAVYGVPTLVIGERALTHGDAMLVRAVIAGRVSGPLPRYVADQPVQAGSAVVLPEGVPTEAFGAVSRAAIVLQRETSAARTRWADIAKRPIAAVPQLVNVPAGEPAGPTWITLDIATHDAVMAMDEGTAIGITATVTPGERTKTWNAVGRLPGREPAGASEVIVLSAHLDHVGAREAPADNIQFARRGVVAHTVSSYGLHKGYHQAPDEIRHVNLEHMRDAIASLVEPVRRLAESSVRPTWNEGLQP